MMWLLLVTVSTAAALTLPKIEVDKALLEKYGVTDDVNQPGYFQKAMDSYNVFRKQYPGAVDMKALWTLVESTATYSIPVILSRQWIVLASAAHAQNLMQVTVAHLLNVAHRFRQTAETVNLLEYGKIKQLQNASNITIINECNKEKMVLDLAHKITSTRGTFDPVKTCDRFLDAIKKDPSILNDRMAASMKAHAALDGVEEMVKNGDRYTFGQIEEQLKTHPIIDPFVYKYFEETLSAKLKDYDKVIRDLHDEPIMQHVYDSIAKRLGTVGIVQQ